MSDERAPGVEEAEGDAVASEEHASGEDLGALCAICQTARLGDSIRTVNGRPACDPCIAEIQRELAAQRTPGSAYATAAAAGCVGALLGAAAWATIAIAADAEVGYVAVLVGFLAGFGVKLGARSSRGVGLQWLAAGFALFGLVAAKYMILAYLLVDYAGQNGIEIGYLDSVVFEAFPTYLEETASFFDALWIILAVGAAYKVPKAAEVAIT
jgi:hypothetical protein